MISCISLPLATGAAVDSLNTGGDCSCTHCNSDVYSWSPRQSLSVILHLQALISTELQSLNHPHTNRQQVGQTGSVFFSERVLHKFFWTLLGYTVTKAWLGLVQQTVSPCERVWSGDKTGMQWLWHPWILRKQGDKQGGPFMDAPWMGPMGTVTVTYTNRE